MRPRAALLLVAILLTACEGRKLTQEDCVRIKHRLESAWERDAVSAQGNSDAFLKFIREEKTRIGTTWMQKCEPMVGRQISEPELNCLDKADTIDDVYECNGGVPAR